VKRVLEEMKNKTNVYIQEVNQEMELFSVALKAYALLEAERIGNLGDDGDQEPMSDELILLMDDWKATETRITEDQHHRNRTIV
jgi:hypothetical protein